MTMVSSLLKAVIEIAKVVPCQALPPAIDALLLATSTPSTLLISSVVDHLSQFLDELALSGKDLGDEEDLLTALMSVIVHLYEISDNVEHLLPSILWTVFVPLLQISRVSTTALCNNVIQALADVFSSKEAWGYAEESLFPYFLKTIDASLERDKGGEINSERGNSYSAPIFSSDNKKVCFEPVALHVVCHVLAALLLKISHLIEIKPLGEECPSSSLEETFCMNLILKFFHPILSLISKTSHDGERQCAISIFLPPALRILYKLKARVLTEQMEQIYRDLWTVLLALFVRGCIHRQDAYSALLVSIGFLLSSPCANNLAGENEMKQNSFSILDDMELWNILKSGMVDSDPLTRKRALQTLKEVLNLGPLCQSTKFQSQTDSRVSTSSFPHLLTKRDTYAAQEARSLGLWNHETEHWKAFFLLYDMLEEYGTHLVEAAWKHQIGVLLPTLCGEDDKVQASHDPVLMGKCYLQNLETSIWWMTVLWERGFAHDNPQVRRLILQSFIELDWVKIPNLGEIVPEKFILGALASALNDPIHHKDFGVKGTYSSEMAAAATSFFNLYAMSLGVRDRTNFVIKMAGDSCVRPLCRQGFMTLIMCLDAVASTPADEKDNTTSTADVSLNSDRQSVTAPLTISVIDSLGVLVEESKKHFNPKYRLKVCYHLLRAARSVVMLQELPYRKFFWFLSLFPLEFIGSRGKLHQDLWAWLISGFYKIDPLSSSGFQTWMTEGLLHRAETFIKPTPNMTDSVTDEDVKAWTQEADKWAKITSLGFLESNNVSRLMVFLRDHTVGIYQRAYNSTCIPEKLLILLVSIIKMFHCFPKDCQPSNYMSQGMERQCTSSPFDIIAANLKSIISLNMDEFLAHAQRVSSVFWDDEVHSDAALPSSVINKLGGRSQRRLPLTVASNVLKAVVSITTVAECISWMLENNSSRISDSSIYFVWEFTWKSVTMKKAKQETKAEIQLSMYEALAPVLKALALSASPHVMSLVNRAVIFGDLQNESILDIITLKFTEAINQLLYGHVLARSRRAVLSVHKWCCLEGLLSIPKWRMTQIDHSERLDICALSDSILKTILVDAISSLESASDDNMLPVLRCLRWLLHWGILSRIDSYEADGESRKVVEVVWSLVRAAWAAIADSNKRRVGLISAFLSAIIHPNIFYQVTMHESNGDAGPLKWLLVNIFKLGSRSPRTMRLTAMHVSGMWLKYPNIVQYYVKELKLLSLHGGESVDEELDGQVSENLEAAREYSFLTQSLDPELVEEFRNSEQYVRVTVAVLLHKLAEIVERDQGSDEVEKRKAANSISVCGKELLLDMLDSLAYDKEMSKELYKKKSAIHRRKVRAWQMLCILSRFVQDEMIEQVMDVLEICLFRNNLPSVRQYGEIFGVQLCLRFPRLIKERIVGKLVDYNLKTQALASYVFISVNVLMHASTEELQNELVEEIVPAVVPYLTTHHHPLRSFSQILIHEVLLRIMKRAQDVEDKKESEIWSLEKRCLKSIALFLDENAECRRIRMAVGKFLSSFDPVAASTPRGLFSLRGGGEEDQSKPLDDIPFECAPVALMEHVSSFLNEARDGLRQSMAADDHEIYMEGLTGHYKPPPYPGAESKLTAEGVADFQKKMASLRFSDTSSIDSDGTNLKNKVPEGNLTISDFEKDEELLLNTMHTRIEDLERMRGNRQELIVVASLLGRIPNVAGLVRTCEVFKASSLVLADASILKDRQFQLISVTAEMWLPIKEVPESGLEEYLAVKVKEGFMIIGLEQTAKSVSLDKFNFPKKTVLVLGKEKEGIPINILQSLDACVEIPQLGVIRSLNVHVSGAIAIWEYTRQILNKCS